MELDANLQSWERDAKTLMTSKLKFLISNWRAKKLDQVEALTRQFNYIFELGDTQSEIYFGPADSD